MYATQTWLDFPWTMADTETHHNRCDRGRLHNASWRMMISSCLACELHEFPRFARLSQEASRLAMIEPPFGTADFSIPTSASVFSQQVW
jgi:hypothetical protein